MCPVCIATVTIYLAGTASTGGLSALVARNFRRRSDAKTATLHAGPRKITGDKEGFGKASNEPVFHQDRFYPRALLPTDSQVERLIDRMTEKYERQI